MNNKLSKTSRILVAFASLALIAVYFLPAWRIDLFAPQYPEGLSMHIWINRITGDVDIINGLNHYIGMKRITVEMFPEFKYLSYVVAFFMLFGLIVAITGNRKMLLAYIILTIIGGLLVLYDLYRWGYEYGHDLDPTAPIKIEGLSYQPPVLGHKRLLNFDAYSFPDIAGWIVIVAGLVATSVWFIEWYRQRKNNIKPPVAIAVFVLTVFLTSCSTNPEPFVSGSDTCYICKMGLADFRFGAEVITKKGKLYKFDDLGCMINYLQNENTDKKNIARTVVINFEKPNSFIDAGNAWFVVSPELKSPMNSNASGFASREAAEKMLAGKSGNILNWNELYEKLK